MTHSTHFIYGYIGRQTYGLRTILIVRKETRYHHSYRLAARVLLYTPSNRQDNTYHGLRYTSRGALAGTRNSSMGAQDSYIWLIHLKDRFRTQLAKHLDWGEFAPKPLSVIYIMLVVKQGDLCDTMFSRPLSYFSFRPVLHDWCNKGRGMCYPVCGMVHIKEP